MTARPKKREEWSERNGGSVRAAYRNMLRVPSMLEGENVTNKDLQDMYDALGIIIMVLEMIEKKNGA